MIIYVDLLIALNLFVNYFLLLGSAVFTHRDIKRVRFALTALFGSLFSLFIFLPSCYSVLVTVLKIPLGAFLVLMGFGYKERRMYIKTLFMFYAVNFIFAGVIFLVWTIFQPKGMVIKNGIVYMVFSPLILIMGTLTAYIAIKIINAIFSKRLEDNNKCEIEIEDNNTKVRVQALIDTGNKLNDPFSGLPVIVCEYSKLRPIIPENLDNFFLDPIKYAKDLENSDWKKKVRLIPYNTVMGNAMLPAFKPHRVYIVEDAKPKETSAYLAITTNKLSDGEYQAVIGTEI